MTYNELVAKIIARAGVLADLKMPDLRLTHPSVVGMGTDYEAKQVTLGQTRGSIIEDILLEEFCLEFDRDIEEA